MKRMLSISFMILITTALAFSPGTGQASPDIEPICLVHPDVLAACEESGGRFDWKLCSCVGGN